MRVFSSSLWWWRSSSSSIVIISTLVVHCSHLLCFPSSAKEALVLLFSFLSQQVGSFTFEQSGHSSHKTFGQQCNCQSFFSCHAHARRASSRLIDTADDHEGVGDAAQDDDDDDQPTQQRSIHFTTELNSQPSPIDLKSLKGNEPRWDTRRLFVRDCASQGVEHLWCSMEFLVV